MCVTPSYQHCLVYTTNPLWTAQLPDCLKYSARHPVKRPLTWQRVNKCCCWSCVSYRCFMSGEQQEGLICGFDEVVQDWLSGCFTYTRAKLQLPLPATHSRTYNKHALTPSAWTHSHTLGPVGAWRNQIACAESVKRSDCWAQCAADVCFTGNQKVMNQNEDAFLFFPEYRLKSNLWWLIMQLQKVTYCR